MWENRISQYVDAAFGQTALPPTHPQALAHQKPGCPHLVQRNDIYQAAHARAVLDHQIGTLFNPDASVE